MNKLISTSFITGMLLSTTVFAAGGNIILTSKAPQYEASENKSPRMITRSFFDKYTTTYIKCAYKVDKYDDSNPASNWIWATSKGKYAKIEGYWYSSLPLANMFYTKVAYGKVMDTCEAALKEAGVSSNIIIPYASNYTLSYYYMIWNQGNNQPSIKVGNTLLDRLVIFGDSLSDTINLYNGSYGTVPNSSSYFLGHFSNGKLWHEYLSTALHLPSYVWATSNAESGYKTFFNGFSEQVDSFRAYYYYSEGYDISKTLFAVLFGGNDFITGGKNPDDIITHYRSQINRLVQLGAKNITVLRLPDLSVAPNVSDWSEADRQKLKNKSIQLNEKIERLITELKMQYAQVKIFSLGADRAFKDIIDNSLKYGYVNKNDTCLATSKSSLSYGIKHSVKAECKNSNAAFVFWDNMHPTTKTHGLLADKLKDELVRGLSDE